MAIESFFHIAIKVDDPEESAAFYQNHLAAEIIEQKLIEPDGTDEVATAVVLQVADKRVYLFDQPPYEAAGLVDSLQTGFLHFGFVVDDIDEAFEQLRAANVDIMMEPMVSGSIKIGFFYGPGGVRMEFIEKLE